MNSIINILRPSHISHNSDVGKFKEGTFAVLCHFNYVIPLLKDLHKDLEFVTMPLISCNDQHISIPYALQIKADTKYPIECLRFLKFLRTEKVQQMMLDHQGIPFNRQLINKNNATKHLNFLENDWVDNIEFMKKYGNTDSCHLDYSIIYDEIWSAIDAGYSAEKALENMTFLGKAYNNLAQFKDVG